MPSYWWQCEECKKTYEFEKVTKSKGIAHFIWDELLTSQWDQNLLIKRCENCDREQLRISYNFPRSNNETILVQHIVGTQPFGDYLPMMWETIFIREPNKLLYDFKYLRNRNVWGLNKPAVLDKEDLLNIFNLYSEKVGIQKFP